MAQPTEAGTPAEAAWLEVAWGSGPGPGPLLTYRGPEGPRRKAATVRLDRDEVRDLAFRLFAEEPTLSRLDMAVLDRASKAYPDLYMEAQSLGHAEAGPPSELEEESRRRLDEAARENPQWANLIQRARAEGERRRRAAWSDCARRLNS